MSVLIFLFCIITAYLAGSICSAVIICRMCNLGDPRLEGSKNPGATNVLRLAGKKYAIFVLLFDMLKGFVPILCFKLLGADSVTLGYSCLAVTIGHIFPVFFEFKGGKGVATALGALLGFNIILGLAVIIIWLTVAFFSQYSSLSSITAVFLAPFIALFITQDLNAFIPLLILALLVTYKHRQNITRLLRREEPKIKFNRKK